MGRSTRADEGRGGCGVRSGSPAKHRRPAASGSWRVPTRLQCCGPPSPAPCTAQKEAACSKWRVPAANLSSCSLNFAGASRPKPRRSWWQGLERAQGRRAGDRPPQPGVAPSPSAFQLVTPLSPAPSHVHRSPQRCNRAGGRRHRNALRFPGQRSHLVLAGDSVVVPQGASPGTVTRAGAQRAGRPEQGNPLPTGQPCFPCFLQAEGGLSPQGAALSLSLLPSSAPP